MKYSIFLSSLALGLALPTATFAFDQSSPADSLVVSETGKVGMGTSTPVFPLHIKRDNASIFIQDVNGATASNVLLTLSKFGIPAFRMTNTANNSSWDFSQRPTKELVISRAGSGAFELVIDEVGNMNVRGTVTAIAHTSTSSRAAKTDFEDIDTKSVLNKIKGLDVTEWRYKNKAAKGRHIGPMAEDFYSLFELGPDNKHVAATDMASIALIAAKELQKQSELAKADTAKLKAENSALKLRLEALEKLVTNIASGEGLLPKNGSAIALK